MAISHPVMLLFLAHAFGVPLPPERILVFVGTILLVSFTSPGIPGGSPGLATLPVFLAAGVPLEGVLILDAVEAIPDISKTITNVTADLSAATIVTRGSATRAATPPQRATSP
jgi:Na+/H+-dicarboxylate symporter